MLFEATFSRSHVVFWISDERKHGRHVHHVPHYPISERQHAQVMRLLFEAISAMFCEISSILLCTHFVLQVMNITYGPIPHLHGTIPMTSF